MPRTLALCFFLISIGSGQTLDDALHALSRKVATHLSAGEVARVASARNLSSLGSGDVARARMGLDRALRQAGARSARRVDVALTVSQNPREVLLVAEFDKGEEHVVEMVPYHPGPPAVRPGRSILQKQLLWEQDAPMLDLATAGEMLLVLEPANIVSYARRNSGWERADGRALDGIGVVRDPRGRLVVTGDSFTAFLPGSVCHGTWMPALEVRCEAAGAGFSLAGQEVHLAAGRNVLQAEDWAPVFSFARVDERGHALYLAAELDGRTHLYNADRKPVGSVETWDDDFVSVETGCGAGHDVLASVVSEGATNDSLAAFEIVDRKAVEVSDPAEFPGPLTALWPAAGGAIAIARNTSTGRYAAYSVTIDCGH